MKKFLCFILLLMVVNLVLMPTTPVNAASVCYDKATSDKIQSEILSLENVEDALVVVYKKYCAVSIKTSTLFFTHQRDAIYNSAREIIKNNARGANEVMISFDLDVYIKGKKIKEKLDNGASILSLRGEIMDIYKMFNR